jgi:SAM-dependent methyltransferase
LANKGLELTIQTSLIVLGAVIVICLAGLWYFVPLLYGLPWIPAKTKRIHRALELAALKPGEKLYDLGAGDGRVLIVAARDYDASAIGIEISPVHCLIAWLRALVMGLLPRVTIRWGNLYKSEFSDADVLFIFLTQGHALRVKDLLESQLRLGTRVVTLSSDLDGWEPVGMDSEHLIFLYIMPPVQGGVGTFLSREGGLSEKGESGAN